MLDPQAADLVDAVARLCVLRTDDYTLLRTVYRRAREHGHVQEHPETPPNPLHFAANSADDAPNAKVCEGEARVAANKMYIRYLTEEVRVREKRRVTEERQWLEAVQQWAARFQTRQVVATQDKTLSEAQDGSASLAVPPIRWFWEQGSEDAFQRVYAAVLQQVYELDRTDLVNTPFAHIDKSKCLYDHRAAEAVPSVPVSSSEVEYVHALFFPSSKVAEPSSSPSRIVAELHPIEAGEASSVNEGRRRRLQASRHAWLVLFFLWCHIVAASMTASAGAAAAARGVGAEPLLYESALLGSARDFLASQSQQLQPLLEKLGTMTFV
ncbi:hypothetical protein, unknown function [Leishmania tarentolae]|uniref:Uncharacterized protein n=1 Tax=Leishmania tarentolae TaxID=5689 RepID=A0A640KUB1_LEITA|nr:hypothetical protein, unknown function [Leishmania tarentolae]